MKKLIFLLFLPFLAMAQVSTGQEQEFDYGIKNNASQTVTSPTWIVTQGTDGTQGKILPLNIPVAPHHTTHEIGGTDPITGENIAITAVPPVSNYTPTDGSLNGQLQGINNKLGQLINPAAGVTNRVYYTGDQTTLIAGTFYNTNPAGKGSVASVQQTVSNNDNEKRYFTQDLIGAAFTATNIFPTGTYNGQLTVSIATDPGAQYKYTVELYRTNSNGTPIASGVSGAPTGSLGVTVILIIDSGNINLVAGNVTNINLSGALGGQFTINTGEHIRYHVSAEKVGTAGAIVAQSVYYGSSYSSYLDVPVLFTTDAIQNKSTVSGTTDTDALNNLNAGKVNIGTFTTNSVLKASNSTTSTNSNITDDGATVSIAAPTLTGSSASSLLNLTQTWNTTGTPTAIKANVTDTASNANSLLMDLQIGGVSKSSINKGGAAVFASSITAEKHNTNSTARGDTGGNFSFFDALTTGLAPTSGTATFSVLNWGGTINQTGGANGITRGVYLNPTLTSAFDYRAFEYTNNTGRGIWGSGTALNSFMGRTLIGTQTDNGNQFRVNGDVDFSGNVAIGATSSSYKLSVIGGKFFFNQIKLPAVIQELSSPYYGAGLTLSTDLGSTQGANRIQARYDGSGKPVLAFEYSTTSQAYSADPTLLSYSEALRITGAGNMVVGSITDNGVDRVQVNGTVSGSPATLSNQFVTKAQNDLKATIGSTTINYIPKLTSTTTMGNSLIYDSGTKIGIGTTSPVEKLHVVGNIFADEVILSTGVIVQSEAPNSLLRADGTATTGYNVYTALANQTGSIAPTSTVLENTIGALNWSYVSTGVYRLSKASGTFNTAKTFVQFQNTQIGRNVHTTVTSSYIEFQVWTSSTGLGTDGSVTNASIEIREYN